MNKTTIISIIGKDDVGTIVDVLHDHEDDKALLAAIRKFLQEWYGTDEGRKAYQDVSGDFNWGDFALWGTTLRGKIPGVYNIVQVYPTVKDDISAIAVDHDELLMDEDNEN